MGANGCTSFCSIQLLQVPSDRNSRGDGKRGPRAPRSGEDLRRPPSEQQLLAAAARAERPREDGEVPLQTQSPKLHRGRSEAQACPLAKQRLPVGKAAAFRGKVCLSSWQNARRDDGASGEKQTHLQVAARVKGRAAQMHRPRAS